MTEPTESTDAGAEAPRYALVDANELEARGGVLKRIRRESGFTAIGVNEFTMPAGWDSYPTHDEQDAGHEEVYICLEGSGTIEVDEEQLAFTPGCYVFVAPDCTRTVRPGPDGLRMIALGAPTSAEYSGRGFF